MTVDDGKPIPHRIRDAIEESDWPELSIREVMDATGLSKDQVLGAAGRGHGLEIDEVTGAVRLLEDDGGEFDDDYGRDLLTDGGVPSDGEGGDSGVTSSDGTDRSSLSREEFNDLLSFDGARGGVTHDLVIRDNNDLLIYATRRKDEEANWRIRSYQVLAENGILFASETLDRTDVATILVEEFGAEQLTSGKQNMTEKVRYGVPTVVAVDGKPAIAAWLYAAQEREREEIAELMDVGDRTVSEYLSRFRRRGDGVPDVEIPEIGEHVPEIPAEFDPTRQQIVADGGRYNEPDTQREGSGQ